MNPAGWWEGTRLGVEGTHPGVDQEYRIGGEKSHRWRLGLACQNCYAMDSPGNFSFGQFSTDLFR